MVIFDHAKRECRDPCRVRRTLKKKFSEIDGKGQKNVEPKVLGIGGLNTKGKRLRLRIGDISPGVALPR